VFLIQREKREEEVGFFWEKWVWGAVGKMAGVGKSPFYFDALGVFPWLA
jgi:hypothetical protein